MKVDRNGLEAAIHKYESIKPVSDPGAITLQAVVEAANRAEDDADLVWIAILLIEPLLDTHWSDIADAFAHALTESQALRQAFRTADIHIPEELESRLRAVGQQN